MQVAIGRCFRFSAGCLVALTLGACTLVAQRDKEAEFEMDFTAAAALAERGAYGEAATAFEALLATAPEQRRGTLRLRAAEAWLEAGDAERARTLAGAVDPAHLESGDRVTLVLLRARFDLMQDRARQALQRLETLAALPLERDERVRYLQVRARALFALGAPVEAVRALVARGALLADPVSLRHNETLLWEGMTRSHGALEPAAEIALDPVLAGWLALGEIGRGAWQDPATAAARVREWETVFPTHPARERFVPELLERLHSRYAFPATVAVLLPFTGRYKAQAEAVRDGLLAAHFRQIAAGGAPRLVFLDTQGQPEGAIRAYHEALAAGAGFLIGPLLKEELSALAAADTPPLPVLALNRLETAPGSSLPPRFYQFALSPEDEAEQVAEHVVQQGLLRGIALVPEGEWGERLLAGFRQRFEALGGTLLAAETYRPQDTDHQTPIMRALNLDRSRLRRQALVALLGTPLEFEPRRRQDVQFVFLAAREAEAPLLRAQLRFHYALDLPVFATSHVYRPDAPPQPDLDGVTFADMPWTLAQEGIVGEVRAEMESLWPQAYARNPRLYALGFDAYRLIPALSDETLPLPQPVAAMTGILSLDSERRVRRGLYWAQFRNGVPRLMQTDTTGLPPAVQAQPPGP
ncbi:MAG TPA: penicillin-binding protein activator [Gammaproteobacteria bacterium]|nr:penicillin-binding protein activator [Gammaproteobacteria bacterium]